MPDYRKYCDIHCEQQQQPNYLNAFEKSNKFVTKSFQNTLRNRLTWMILEANCLAHIQRTASLMIRKQRAKQITPRMIKSQNHLQLERTSWNVEETDALALLMIRMIQS